MKRRTIAIGLLCSANLIALTGTLQAQTDHYIENQRYVVGVSDVAWGDTYVGQSSSGNAMIVTNWINGATTNPITLSVQSLQIGAASSLSNLVYIGEGGTLQIEDSVMVLGTNNGNALLLDNQGSLFVQSDFNAQMGGFLYASGANLKVGGEISNLDDVEGGLNFTLTGENASWNFGTNTLSIGTTSGSNSVTIAGNSQMAIDNLSIGTIGTTSNSLVVTEGSRASIQSNITIQGSGNFLSVTNGGWLEVGMDFDAGMTGFDLGKGGGLIAHQALTLGSITNGSFIVLDGMHAVWDRTGLTMDIGSSTNANGNSLTVRNGANAYADQLNLGSFSGANLLTITNNGTVQADNIQVGSTNTQGNAVRIADGGNLILNGTGSYINASNSISVVEGGKLTIMQNFGSALGWNNDAHFYWRNGGIIECFGAAPIFSSYRVNNEYTEYGTLFLQDGQILVLNGLGATWNAGSHNLHVGDLSSGNALILTNGATATVNSMTVGDFATGGHDNHVVVTGAGSTLTAINDIELGGRMLSGVWTDGGANNTITVGSGGTLSTLGTLYNRNSSGTGGLLLEQGSTVNAGNYYQANDAYLLYNLESIPTNAGLLQVTGTAEFEKGAQIGFTSVGGLAFNASYTNMILSSSTLVIDGVTNATSSDLRKLDLSGNTLMNFIVFESNQDIYAIMNRLYLSQSAGYTRGSMMWDIANEIDRLSLNGNSAAANQIDILNSMSGSLQRSQLNQLYAYQMPTYEHSRGVFGGIDQIRARGASFHGTATPSGLPQPDGVKGPGPHAEDQGLQGWAKVYGSYGNRDDSKSFNDGYDAQTYGTVIGLDQAFNDWLFGVAGGYAGTTIDGDNGDESEASTGYGMLYASYGTKDWFGDLVVSYGDSSIDNDSGTAFGVKSSTDASQTAFYIGGGREFKDPDGSSALLRPLLALQASQYDQDGYTEKSSNAVTKQVDDFDHWSYQTILGAEMILPAKGTTVDIDTELRAYWLHEFNDDEENVDYTLVGSSQTGEFVMRAPESDVGQLGIGCVAKWENGLQLRTDLDAQISDGFFATTLSGALLYEF